MLQPEKCLWRVKSAGVRKSTRPPSTRLRPILSSVSCLRLEPSLVIAGFLFRRRLLIHCSNCSNIEESYRQNPFIPEGGCVDDERFVCPSCKTEWWQYHSYYHLWTDLDDDTRPIFNGKESEPASPQKGECPISG